MKKNVLPLMLVSLFFVLALIGCTEKHTGWEEENGEYSTLLFKMRLFNKDMPSARSLTAQQEAFVEELDVLVFSVVGESEEFLYHTTPEAGWDNTTGTFSVKLINSEHINDYKRIVLIANQSDKIEELKSSFTGLSKADVLAMLVFDADFAWPTDAGFVPIPMWGESLKPIIVSPKHTPLGEIDMIRALSRVDVGVNVQVENGALVAKGLAENLGDPEPFVLTGIKVYNSNTQGRVAPLASVFSGTAVTEPTIPATAVTQTLTYDYSPGVIGAVYDIYLPEALNKGRDQEAVLCLLLKGYYTQPGAVANTTDESWYRVDFYNRSATGQPHNNRIDILRNHTYLVNINAVEGPGAATEQEALDAYLTRMTADIQVWDEAALANVEVKANNTLLVEPGKVELGKTGRTGNTVRVTSGLAWTAEISMAPNEVSGTVDWLNLTTASGGAGGADIVFNSLTNGAIERYAYIHVTSGRLTAVVKVTQLNRELVTLDVSPAEMIFYGKSWMIDDQALTVNWTPAAAELTVEYLPVANGGVELDTRFDDVFFNGSETFYVQAKPWTDYNKTTDLFKVKQSKFRFTATHANGTTVSKEVVVKQFMPDVKVSSPAYGYSMLGQNETLTVTSNVPWGARIAVAGTSTAPAIVSLPTAAGTGTMSTEPLVMKTNVGTKDIHKGISEIIVYSPEGLFEPVNATISGRYGYIYQSTNEENAGNWMVVFPEDGGSKYDRGDAIDYCKKLRNSWFLPSSKEMRSMREKLGTKNGTIPFSGDVMKNDYGFKADDVYWSSTDQLAGSSGVVIKMTDTSDTTWDWILWGSNYARCVKDYHSF